MTYSLKYMKTWKHIIIKPAEKGEVVVFMNRDAYTYEVFRQLSDTKF